MHAPNWDTVVTVPIFLNCSRNTVQINITFTNVATYVCYVPNYPIFYSKVNIVGTHFLPATI